MSSENAIKLNYWLVPFSFLYGIGVRFRNQLFNWGILPRERYDVPVICVGNLAVGGTGKTPHTEHIIRTLKGKYRIAVLSRGYKRGSSGFVLANENSTSYDIGDEPYQMKQKFPDILIAVDADRRRGIKNLLGLPTDKRPEVILLDDGFQHRYVTPSLSIILTDYHRLFYHDKLLPVGRLREPIQAIQRTDIVIVTKCKNDLKPIEFRIIEDHMKLVAHQKVFFTKTVYGEIQPVFKSYALPRVKRDIRRNDDVLVIAGIAYPEEFIREVKKYSHKVSVHSFPDHHNFTQKDIEQIDGEFSKMTSPEKLILVTEKDAARLLDNPLIPEEWKTRLYSQPIQISFYGEKKEAFNEIIKKHIDTVIHHGFVD